MNEQTPSNLKLLISSHELTTRISELAAMINANLAGASSAGQGIPEFLVILKGAFLFGSDLYRQFHGEAHLNFIHAASYQGSESTSDLTIEGDLTFARGKTVLVVEDIIDTGRTLSALIERLRSQNPARIELVSLLYKDAARTRKVIDTLPVDRLYLGFKVPDQFVVGYGLDYDQSYRNFDGIYVLDVDTAK